MLQPYGRKKGERPRVLLLMVVLVPFIGGLSVGGWYYGPALYYQFSGDAVVRISKRVEAYEARLLSTGQTASDLYTQIEDMRRILNLVERENPANAQIQYYQGLFDFFELILRLRLDGPSLVQLTGRGYLPAEMAGLGLPAHKATDIARRISLRMRRALALDPNLPQAPLAGMTLAYADLLTTGRTDPILFQWMKKVNVSELREAYRPYAIWIGLALYSLQGKKAELDALAAEMEKPGTPKEAPGFRLDPDSLRLVLCHGMFQARDYLRALDLARQVRASSAPDSIRSEAVRMEGEIFLIQSGPDAARPYFEEAKRMASGKDPFFDNRLKALSERDGKKKEQ